MIRKLKNSTTEIDTVMQLWLKSTIEAHPFISENHWTDHYDIIKNDYIPQSDTFVYIEKNHILGFISIIDENFIGALFVDVNTQGLGIGKKLIQHVSSIYEDLRLAVYKDNTNALNFYTHLGFTIIKQQINDDTGATEYIMSNS